MDKSFYNIEFPILSLFVKLQQNGYLLNIDDYSNFEKAINQSFGSSSKDDLMQLCKFLWLKNTKNNDEFEMFFNESYQNENQLFIKILDSIAKAKNDNSKKKTDQNTSNQSIDSQENNEDIDTIDNDKNKVKPAPQKKSTSETDNSETLYLSLGENYIDSQQIAIEKAKMEQEFHFIISEKNFYPFVDRHLQLLWRNFRKNNYRTDFSTVDIDRCVEDICQNKILTNIYYEQKLVNEAQLITIVDKGGSMTSFKWLSKQIANTATKEIGKNTIFYCNNLPVPVLFEDEKQSKEVQWNSFIQTVSNKSFLIISDAGVVNEGFNSKRIEITKKMLHQIKSTNSKVVWLNPMPENKWSKTSANQIRQSVRMYECTYEGILQAISLLKK